MVTPTTVPYPGKKEPIRFGIIGYQGIGAAHAVAICRSGIGYVDTIIDTDPEKVRLRLLEQGGSMMGTSHPREGQVAVLNGVTHTNEWSYIDEEAKQLHNLTLYDAKAFKSTCNSLTPQLHWIVACPNQYKKEYVDWLLFQGVDKILVEKPFDITGYDHRVIVGYEWTYHPMLYNNITMNSPYKVVMFHDEPLQDHYGTVADDLLPHLISIGELLGGDPNNRTYIGGHNTANLELLEGVEFDPGTYIATENMVVHLEWDNLFDRQLQAWVNGNDAQLNRTLMVQRYVQDKLNAIKGLTLDERNISLQIKQGWHAVEV